MAAPAAADPQQPSADGVGVYRPRRPRASPLYRLLERHFRELSLVWDERFGPAFGDWRGVIPKVVDQFLACALPEHGFARIRCVALKKRDAEQDTTGAAGFEPATSRLTPGRSAS